MLDTHPQAIAAEAAYRGLIRATCHLLPFPRRVEVQPSVVDDGETDCWTHAWDYAAADPARRRYVEGLCRRSPSERHGATHAWVEETGPLGVVLVELTADYENASQYMGLVVRTDGIAAEATADWKVRSSVLQTALVAGMPREQILADLVAPR